MEYLQSILVILLEMACFCLFQDIFIKSSLKHKRVSMPIVIIVMTLFSYGGSYLFDAYFIIKELYMVAILTLGLSVLKKGSWKRNLLISVMFMFLLIAADLITISIDANILLVSDDEKEMAGALIVLMSKAILLLIIVLIKPVVGEKWGYGSDAFDEIWHVIFPIVSICTIAAILSKGYGMQNDKDILFIWCVVFCLIAMNVFLMFYVKNNSEKNMLLQEKSLFEMDAKEQRILYRSLEEKIELQKRLSHDYKNHLSYISGLLENKQYDKIDAYIEKLNGKVEHDLDMIDTNNPIINTVINTKYYEAKKAGAIVVCKINDLSNIKMEEVDIIVLLSNLFNNAIEAVVKCDREKSIKFKVLHEKDKLVVSFQNTYCGVVKRDGELFRTTKKDRKGFHGIGIKNIINVVNKYNGEYQFDITDEIFRIVIVIPTN